jgi:lipoprotein-anchoring transpeptidase ErfK/SrfK
MNYLTLRLSLCPALSILSVLVLGLPPARGDFLWFKSQEKAKITAPSQLVGGQAPAVINQAAYDKLTPGNISIVVSLSRQRLLVKAGDETAIDSPVSSGKKARPTPAGTFPILQKDPDHHSNVYGNFVDSRGRVVRGGVSALIDSAPSGSHFEGAPMTWFMRLTWEGVGMHVGILPGYAASHGCIRLPSQVAHDLYAKVNVGTVVRVEN